jgi:ABC-type iron transport system FetAB permease component
MDSSPPSSDSNLEWSNVGFGLAFVTLNIALSQALQLHIGASLAVAALRCVVQLTVMATVLQRVFAAQNVWAVGGIARTFFLMGVFITRAGSLTLKRCQCY